MNFQKTSEGGWGGVISDPKYIRPEAPKLIGARRAPGKTRPKAANFLVV